MTTTQSYLYDEYVNDPFSRASSIYNDLEIYDDGTKLEIPETEIQQINLRNYLYMALVQENEQDYQAAWKKVISNAIWENSTYKQLFSIPLAAYINELRYVKVNLPTGTWGPRYVLTLNTDNYYNLFVSKLEERNAYYYIELLAKLGMLYRERNNLVINIINIEMSNIYYEKMISIFHYDWTFQSILSDENFSSKYPSANIPSDLKFEAPLNSLLPLF